MKRISWKEFRETGLFQFANSVLHVFGMAIVISVKDGEVVDVYPARVAFRGFTNEDNDEMHVKIADYLAKESGNFPDEIKNEQLS